MDSGFDLLAILLALAALFGYLNHRVLRLPLTVGLLVCALAGTLALIGLDAALPQFGLKLALRAFLESLNFPATLLDGVLAFLLFAAALGVDSSGLFERKWTILALATVGTVISTALIAGALLVLSMLLGLGIPLTWCLLFGALISPTDPVAVLLVLKRVGIPRHLEAIIAGESLFNDGVGVVIFTVILSIATGDGVVGFRAPTAAGLFLLEAVGGGLLGLVLGYIAFRLIQRVDDYNVELIISLALVTGTYSLARLIGVSGPVAVVVAGILIGNQGMNLAMSEETRRHLKTFWLLVDDTLNALLFLLIGLEVAAINLDRRNLVAMAAMVPLTLAIRWISVGASASPLNLRLPDRFGSLTVLTWGGLRGGLSVAMALALPVAPWKAAVLTISYGIVVFSIVVQGLTLEWVARRTLSALAEPLAPQTRKVDGAPSVDASSITAPERNC